MTAGHLEPDRIYANFKERYYWPEMERRLEILSSNKWTPVETPPKD